MALGVLFVDGFVQLLLDDVASVSGGQDLAGEIFVEVEHFEVE